MRSFRLGALACAGVLTIAACAIDPARQAELQQRLDQSLDLGMIEPIVYQLPAKTPAGGEFTLASLAYEMNAAVDKLSSLPKSHVGERTKLSTGNTSAKFFKRKLEFNEQSGELTLWFWEGYTEYTPSGQLDVTGLTGLYDLPPIFHDRGETAKSTVKRSVAYVIDVTKKAEGETAIFTLTSRPKGVQTRGDYLVNATTSWTADVKNILAGLRTTPLHRVHYVKGELQSPYSEAATNATLRRELDALGRKLKIGDREVPVNFIVEPYKKASRVFYTADVPYEISPNGTTTLSANTETEIKSKIEELMMH